MRALVIDRPGEARVIEMERPVAGPLEATMRVRRLGLCGSDLSTYLGKNPMVTYPRIPGHEVGATLEHVPANDLGLIDGNECYDVALYELRQVYLLPPGPLQCVP